MRRPFPPLDLIVALVVVAAVAASCGTSGVELADEAQAAGPAESTSSTSTTSSTTTTTTSSTTTSTTTTTTTLPPAPLARTDSGTPLNEQTRGVLITPTDVRAPVIGRTDAGWRVWTPCGNETDIADGTYVETVDVVLDPGHGGTEPGATGANGVIEKDLNIVVSGLVAQGLESLGHTVLQTRTTDIRVPLLTRAEIAHAVDARAFVSIHHNAGTDAPSTDPGTEVFHQIESAESRRLAGLLQEEIYAAMSVHDVAWVSIEPTGAQVRANREGGDFYGVLRRSAGIPAAIAEGAYLSNPPEADLLARPDVQQQEADAIVRAIDRFLTSDDPGSGFVDDPVFRGHASSGTGRATNCTDPVMG